MNTDTVTQTAKPIEVVVTGPKDTDEFIKGLWAQNPIFVQVLGMCPTLAVTNSVVNALAMGLATLFVLFMSSILVSSLCTSSPGKCASPATSLLSPPLSPP